MITQKRTISFLEKKEVESIIKAIKPKGRRNLRDRALIQTLFSTGLRLSECLALPDAPFAATQKDTIELSICGKGGWVRTVYFAPSVVKMIREYLVIKKEVSEKLLIWELTPRAVQLIVKRRALAAGFEGIHPHTLRHSFGTYIIFKGENLRIAQELLGHRSITSTQIYTHITSPELKSAHKRLFK